MINDKKKSVFFDKRDENYLQLTSPIFFFEMFTKKKIKCDIIIPQTVIFSKGIATLWLFNSKVTQTPIILKKNSNKLNNVEICRVFCKVKQSDDYRIDTLTTLLDIVKSQKNEIVAFGRLNKITKTLSKIDLVKSFLDGNMNGLQILQDQLNNFSKADELYFVEYRYDVVNLPVSYRFFKKSTTQLQQIIKKGQQFSQQTQNSESYEDQQQQREHIEYVENMFKFFDNSMNQNLTKIVKKLVDFLEKAYKIRIKKLIAKFMQNDQQIIYFLGIKELLIDFRENSPYEIENLKNELKENNSFENFLILIKMFTRMNNNKPLKIPATIYEDDKEISQRLYKNLIVQKCVGDFCDYIMEEKNRGPLQIRKNIVTDYKKYFGNKKMNDEKFTVTLPNEISFQLILRTRECSEEIIQVLMKNKIFTKNSKQHFQESDKINTDEEYPFKFNKTEVYNLPNLYKTVKICKNCFVVYSLASKYFDTRLNNDLQQKQWLKRESTSLQKTTLNPNSQNLSKLDQSNLKKSINKSINKSNLNQSIEKIKTTHSQIELEQNKVNVRKIQSAKQFRVTQTHQIQPKTFKLFMPAQIQRQQSAKISNQTQRNTIDINRLTMGFLNYTKPPKPQKLPSAKSHLGTLQSQRSQIDSQHMRSESLNDVQRKISRTNNKSLNKISFFNTKLRQISVSDRNYTLLEVCQIMDLEYPPESVPDLYLDSINYFCYQNCAIPYLVLLNSEESQSQSQQDQSLDLTQKEHKTIIYLGDFFDNSFQNLQIMQQNIKSNTTIILLNLPGQSYTIFDPTIIYNNLDISLLIDSLLYELQFKDIIKQTDIFQFIGIGYGGFQILSYLSFVQNNLPKIGKVLIINGFCEVDEMLIDTLKKSKEVFIKCPPDMPELGFHFWNSMIQSQEEKLEPRLNPIQLNGRLYIIEGLLRSQNLWNATQNETNFQIIHGLKNCVVNIRQAEEIQNFISGNSRSEISLLDFGHKIPNLEELLIDFL